MHLAAFHRILLPYMETRKSNHIILAIETSCDETAAAVLDYSTTGGLPEIQTLSSVVKSQIAIHKRFGGVVPEAAARAHVKNILPVVQKALADAGVTLPNVDTIAPTAGPGLIPSLIVGVEFAKALALASGKPLLPVNHMAGHLYSPFSKIKDERLKMKSVFPMVSLIVSGGHTMLVLMKNQKEYTVLGQTVDDAAGEAFDKVAKLLGLPYPGGPEVSKLSAQIKSTNLIFPRPMIHSKDYNFSFSGLKTAVLYHVRDHKDQKKADICKAFEDAVVDVLVTKTMKAVVQYKAKSVSLSGGVAANLSLRQRLLTSCQKSRVNFFVPPKNLCTDNAEMIGIAAAFALDNGKKPVPLANVQADPGLSL